METTGLTVWITASQAAHFTMLDRRRRLEEKATLDRLVAEGIPKMEARMTVARMRPGTWPSIQVRVAVSVRRRLAEPDLAGPWEPLTEAERERMALAGRWPGPQPGGGLAQRNYDMPSELVTALRTASFRVSAGPLDELERLGLVGSGLVLTAPERARRDELAQLIHSPGRIVRQALDRHEMGKK